MQDIIQALRTNLGRVIRGKGDAIELVLTALCSGGHVLIEDVPGVGKTTLAKALARSIRGEFRRIQFTPDLLPTDIVGGMVYSPKTGDFTFRPGPVFCNILLADEINRASPRTQSALLEAMNEQQSTIEGRCYPLPDPFMVMATQNSIEYHGTYPLPEAQLDRFALRIELGYPTAAEEMQVILDQRQRHPLSDLEPVASCEDILAVRQRVREIDVEPTVVRYMTEAVRATRNDASLRLGASPRAALVLYRMCQALALVRKRSFVLPDDVKHLAVPVLAHRLVLDTKAQYAGAPKQDLVQRAMASVKVPI